MVEAEAAFTFSRTLLMPYQVHFVNKTNITVPTHKLPTQLDNMHVKVLTKLDYALRKLLVAYRTT